MFEKLRHVIFGTKSEKIIIKLEQMELELKDHETTNAELEAGADRVSPTKEPKPRPERKPLPEHLSREAVTHTPSGDCRADCGGQLRQFGEDVSEQLEYIPYSSKVSVTCGRSSLAQAVIASLKHHVRDDRPAGEHTAPAVGFAYSADRKGQHPRQQLKTFNGALQADASAGFHHLYGEDIYETACWAHYLESGVIRRNRGIPLEAWCRTAVLHCQLQITLITFGGRPEASVMRAMASQIRTSSRTVPKGVEDLSLYPEIAGDVAACRCNRRMSQLIPDYGYIDACLEESDGTTVPHPMRSAQD